MNDSNTIQMTFNVTKNEHKIFKLYMLHRDLKNVEWLKLQIKKMKRDLLGNFPSEMKKQKRRTR